MAADTGRTKYRVLFRGRTRDERFSLLLEQPSWLKFGKEQGFRLVARYQEGRKKATSVSWNLTPEEFEKLIDRLCPRLSDYVTKGRKSKEVF